MEFDTETDPETLYELFGVDADALAESVSSCASRTRVLTIVQIEDLSGFTFWNDVVL